MVWDGRVRGFGRGGRVWRRPQEVNLGRKWVETEDEGKFSHEKLRVVPGLLLVVPAHQNTPLEIKIQARLANTGIVDLQTIFAPILR